MEIERSHLQAYEYLCHLSEAKQWLETCLEIEIEEIDFEGFSLQNGILLAKLAKIFHPTSVKKIYFGEKLTYKHSDNIHFFLEACKAIGLPQVFLFELTDLYSRKNIPKVIYCIHALSHLLYKKGLTTNIQDLVGYLDFTDDQLQLTKKELDINGYHFPAFLNVSYDLSRAMEGTASLRIKKKSKLESYSFDTILIEDSRDLNNNDNKEEEIPFEWERYEPFIVMAQSYVRGIQQRKRKKELDNQLKQYQTSIKALQAIGRGCLTRLYTMEPIYQIRTIRECIDIQLVQQIQAVARKVLIHLMTENGISCMQSFLPLLEDSDKDFAEELELEELRKSSIKKIRDIGQTENQLNELDIKIALLVRNRISLEEVLRITRMNGILGSNSGNSNNLSDLEVKENKVIPLKKLDKENRKRLEGYQQLFYLLQTQPIYLGKLLTLINQNILTNEYKKFFETVVLTLFGFAQNKREEFMLLNLFKTAIHIELDSINRIEDFLRGNPVFIKLAVHYNRGVKERKYLRDLLQPIIQQILQDPNIDLQTNPLLIYRALIKQEELRTGEKSLRPYDVTAEIALNDSETRSVLIQHLQQLRSITDQFIERIYSSLDQMPYGIRYIAKELKASLLKKFPNERENVIIKIVGHLVYYRYINPAIVAPESFDVIEVEISPHHRRCLAEVAKMLNQVSMGKLFNEDNIFLQPLNTYVAYTSEKFAKYIYSVTEVVEPEIQFEIDEFLDLTFTKRPVIYISPNEIYSLHKMLINNLDWLTNGDKDQLKIILKEIGDPPTISADQVLAHSKEISLHLSNRFPSINESDCELKHLFVETKRLMTYVLRVQSGSSLLEVLQKPVSQNEETRFKDLLQKERKESNENDNNSSSSQKLIDVTSMSFAQLKQIAFNNALKLEAEGMLKREDNYQVMIHSIAADIRSKSKRRISRKEELKRIYQTINNLKIKERYLIDQHSIYQDYLDSCMNMHSSKKNKKTKAIPFTKQYFHLKEISKSGSVPKFGSFKYTADRLYQKGILISIKDYLPRQFDKIDFIISSDQVGQFKVAAYYMGRKLPGEDTIISLESLLQAQFDNQLVIDLLDEEVKVNVNLLLHFINKKFYI
ncbi:Rho GTPase activation protein [Neoconidiobolus thromboides FSU 785]|nr:Rho GTPase activation protein [Neoconidiobolus thromboides FSU 785]